MANGGKCKVQVQGTNGSCGVLALLDFEHPGLTLAGSLQFSP